MSLEFSNSSYDTTETQITTQITTPQRKEIPNTTQTVDTSNINTVDTTQKAKTTLETTDTKEEDKKQKKFDELKKIFPALANTPNLKNSESIITTLKQFSDSFITKDSKSWKLLMKDKDLFDIRKLKKDPNAIYDNEKKDPNFEARKHNIQILLSKQKSPNQIQLAIKNIQNFMRNSHYEHLRANLNEQRIAPKMERLKNLIGADQMKTAQKISDQDGNLTFEVFLDDYLSKNFTLPWTKDIGQIYSTWEFYYITKLSNRTPERYKYALQTTTENNQRFKNEALSQTRNPNNINEVKSKNEISIRKAKEANGLLNRQELIISALKTTKDNKDLIKKIQVIWQVYYNNNQISIDGVRWVQTQAIAEKLANEFKDNEKFNAHWIIKNLEGLIKRQKKYNTKAFKEGLARNQKYTAFDSSTTDASRKFNLENNPLLKGQRKTEELTKDEKDNTQAMTRHSFENLDNTTISNMIPTEEEEKAAGAFVDRLIKEGLISIKDQKDQNSNSDTDSKEESQTSLSFSSKREAIKTVLSWEISTEKLRDLNQARENSPEKTELFNKRKEQLTEALKFSASQTVIDAGANFLRNMGVQLEWTQKLITVSEEVHYYEFTSTDGIKYYYRPDTWNISTPNLSTIDHKQKSLKIWLQENYTILHHIPTYAQLTDQAQNLSFLNTQKPESSADLAKIIKKGMDQNISLSVWDLETIAVKEVIQKETAKTQIAEDLQSIFGNQYLNNITETLNPELYKTLQPLLNTLSNPNLTSRELSTLRKLTNTLSQRAKTPPPQSPNAKFQEFTHMNQLALDTPQNLFVLLSNQDELNKLADPNLRKNTNQNPEIAQQKTEFWLSILFKFLEKPIEWKWSEFNILDLQKLDPLINNLSDPNLLKNGYKNLIENIKNTYRPIIEFQAGIRDRTAAHEALQRAKDLP